MNFLDYRQWAVAEFFSMRDDEWEQWMYAFLFLWASNERIIL